MGRLPKSSPPGIDTRARPVRASKRPEDDHRGPHLLHQLVGRFGDEGGGDIDEKVAGPTVVAGLGPASPDSRWSAGRRP